MPNYDPQQLQQKFERWRNLYRQQLIAQQQWLEAEALFKELKDYYQNPQWLADHDNQLDLNYSGDEHSILSEDTLWNMITDRDELAISWMRLALNAIENK